MADSRLRLQVSSSIVDITRSKRNYGSPCTLGTLRYNNDVPYTCAHNKPNKVTVPVIHKDECRLCHATCKDTVPSVKKKPATETVTCDKKLWFEASTWCISRIIHLVFPVLKRRQLEAEQGPTFSNSTYRRCSLHCSHLSQDIKRERKQNNTCLDGSDDKTRGNTSYWSIAKVSRVLLEVTWSDFPVRSMETKTLFNS